MKPEELVGEYVYHTAEIDAPHYPDTLSLGADGTYTLLHLAGGDRDSTEEGVWRLVYDPTPEVLLDHAGFPVEVEGNEVRLLIDEDVGRWYYKRMGS